MRIGKLFEIRSGDICTGAFVQVFVVWREKFVIVNINWSPKSRWRFLFGSRMGFDRLVIQDVL